MATLKNMRSIAENYQQFDKAQPLPKEARHMTTMARR
jgi:hypothetical protein